MSTSAYTSFADMVPRVIKACGNPTPPKGLCLSELITAAGAFCGKTGCWQEWLLPMPAVAGQVRYALTWAYDARIDGVSAVALDGELQRTNWYTIEQASVIKFLPQRAPRVSTSSVAFDAAANYAANTLVLADDSKYYRNPLAVTAGTWDPTEWVESEDGLHVQVVFVPTEGATTLPSWFYDRFADAIIAGAVCNIKSARGPYQDLATVRSWQVLWDSAVNDATVDTIMGDNDGVLTAQVQGVVD